MKGLATLLLAAGAVLSGCSSATPCTVVRDCPSTQRCLNGSCVDPGGSPPGAVGEACRSSGDCGSSLVCETTGFVGGFCSAPCTSTPDCASPAACTPVASTSLCMPTCTADSQCRKGYGCCPSLGNVCVPLAACTPAACMRPVVDSALPAGQVQQFGTRKVGDTITFTVPPNTGSLTIVQQAQLATLNIVYKNQLIDNSAVPLTIALPDGGVVYDDRTFSPPSSPDGGVDSSGDYSFYGGSTPSTAAFTLPNTSASLDAGVPSGDWKFVVNDYANECTFLSGCNDGGTAENTYDVSVVTRGAEGATLDVAFYIATDSIGAQPFNETVAATNATVTRMVDTYKTIFARAGITVNASFIDLGATDKARFGTNISANSTSPCDDMSQMFTLSTNRVRLSDGAVLPGNTMNVFLVQSLRDASGGGGGTIVGIDATIPGPSSYNGTVQSGALVIAADLFSGSCGGSINVGSCGADRVGYIAAHETGHFLGLFHTTEQEGADFDPLADTPKCPCLNCANATDRPRCGTTGATAPFITADRCVSSSCGGGSNLMFWFMDSGSPSLSTGQLSAEQGKLMRLNPLVH